MKYISYLLVHLLTTYHRDTLRYVTGKLTWHRFYAISCRIALNAFLLGQPLLGHVDLTRKIPHHSIRISLQSFASEMTNVVICRLHLNFWKTQSESLWKRLQERYFACPSPDYRITRKGRTVWYNYLLYKYWPKLLWENKITTVFLVWW